MKRLIALLLALALTCVCPCALAASPGINGFVSDVLDELTRLDLDRQQLSLTLGGSGLSLRIQRRSGLTSLELGGLGLYTANPLTGGRMRVDEAVIEFNREAVWLSSPSFGCYTAAFADIEDLLNLSANQIGDLPSLDALKKLDFRAIGEAAGEYLSLLLRCASSATADRDGNTTLQIRFTQLSQLQAADEWITLFCGRGAWQRAAMALLELSGAAGEALGLSGTEGITGAQDLVRELKTLQEEQIRPNIERYRERGAAPRADYAVEITVDRNGSFVSGRYVESNRELLALSYPEGGSTLQLRTQGQTWNFVSTHRSQVTVYEGSERNALGTATQIRENGRWTLSFDGFSLTIGEQDTARVPLSDQNPVNLTPILQAMNQSGQ